MVDKTTNDSFVENISFANRWIDSMMDSDRALKHWVLLTVMRGVLGDILRRMKQESSQYNTLRTLTLFVISFGFT
ncbi:hypothetical protein DICVIV_14026 [Dictyocaulus viviparus]|uniref:Uncharacterized protein n=1 Tax=Dictyocaulus viviparus TaxID=29172 RepID=A0A0D8X8U6_DICVI|nr:hypothetical protein DICVIV_14026 [Dictyocaulus viviparus]